MEFELIRGRQVLILLDLVARKSSQKSWKKKDWSIISTVKVCLFKKNNFEVYFWIFVLDDDWNQLSDSSTLIGDSSSTNEVNHEKLFKVNEVKIDALSKELATLNKRYTELTSEHKQLQKKAIGFHNQSTTNEKIIKELKARESDFLVFFLLCFFSPFL